MKKKFSVSWRGSKQKRKKRKYRANAPLHLRHKMMSANLSKELRKKYGKRSFPVRKGDTVKVMRGKSKGKTGKINNLDLKKMRVSIEGLQIQKKDGTKINLYFDPSNLQIQELSLEDKKRDAVLRRKAGKVEDVREKEKRKYSKKGIKASAENTEGVKIKEERKKIKEKKENVS